MSDKIKNALVGAMMLAATGATSADAAEAKPAQKNADIQKMPLVHTTQAAQANPKESGVIVVNPDDDVRIVNKKKETITNIEGHISLAREDEKLVPAITTTTKTINCKTGESTWDKETYTKGQDGVTHAGAEELASFAGNHIKSEFKYMSTKEQNKIVKECLKEGFSNPKVAPAL